MGKSLRLYRSICANAGIDGITQDVANRRCVPLCPTAGQFPLLGQMNGDAVRPHILLAVKPEDGFDHLCLCRVEIFISLNAKIVAKILFEILNIKLPFSI